MPSVFLVLLLVVTIPCETKKNENTVTEFLCPFSRIPISFEHFVANSSEPTEKNNNRNWTRCTTPDHSCAKIKIDEDLHVFGCFSDYGEKKPAFFRKKDGRYLVSYGNFATMRKGCGWLRNDGIARERTNTTVTWNGTTFVTEIVCCKGSLCHGQNWKKVWGDDDDPEILDVFWYTSIGVSSFLFCMIVVKISMTVHESVKERVVINELKEINPELKEADEEDRWKRRSAIVGLFRCRRRKKAKKRSVDSASSSRETTDTTKALVRNKPSSK